MRDVAIVYVNGDRPLRCLWHILSRVGRVGDDRFCLATECDFQMTVADVGMWVSEKKLNDMEKSSRVIGEERDDT
jgi:hypothetical protein